MLLALDKPEVPPQLLFRDEIVPALITPIWKSEGNTTVLAVRSVCGVPTPVLLDICLATVTDRCAISVTHAHLVEPGWQLLPRLISNDDCKIADIQSSACAICDAVAIDQGQCAAGNSHTFSFEAVSPTGSASDRLRVAVSIDFPIVSAAFQLHVQISAAQADGHSVNVTKVERLVEAMSGKTMARSELLLGAATDMQRIIYQHVVQSPTLCDKLQTWALGLPDVLDIWPAGINLQLTQPYFQVIIASNGIATIEV
jgi:hypothetical protein